MLLPLCRLRQPHTLKKPSPLTRLAAAASPQTDTTRASHHCFSSHTRPGRVQARRPQLLARSARPVPFRPSFLPRTSAMPQSTTASSSAHKKQKPPPVAPRPSASILLVSPANQVLLLHRVQTSSSFPSAHVFPGGNCSVHHDGAIPDDGDPKRHCDGDVYRWAGIRETFEESGILLARRKGEEGLMRVGEEEREKARREVHGGERKFGKVLEEWGAVADLENLIPFTRWITPTNVPKRFTTQMYLYFMPLPSSSTNTGTTTVPGLPSNGSDEAVIAVPTHDGGIEHTAAKFAPAETWLAQARAGDIILFPPQFFLLHLVSQYLSPSSSPQPLAPDVLQQQRDALLEFVKRGAWNDVVISPSMIAKRKSDGRVVLGLDKSGPELEGSGRQGVKDYVVLVNFKKEGPRDVEVGMRSEVLAEERGKL